MSVDFRRITHPGPTKNYEPLPSSGRAGRNLPAAVGVGVGLAALFLAVLFISNEAFVVLVSVAVVLALWELAGAFARKNREIVLPLAWVGGVGMVVCAHFLGLEAVLGALTVTVFAVAVWKLLDGRSPQAMLDIMVTTFALIYVALLASFVVLILDSPGAQAAVITWVLLSVANDTGGWAFGIMWGKHPMAPKISPKKSWEGFAGSLVFSVAAGIGGMVWLGGAWWLGIPLALLTTVAGTFGDLIESLIKRDVGLKDMSNMLPGHGGLMDRLDSLLMTAPVVYFFLKVAMQW
ncbi:phosphatidate cytidylyltransferase [Gleimia europaea]|uniref:phosphatidate cytidylyltransferase n=1 Tax=Gleimia europaea TaxID=66228 RepID=UPI00058CFF15|nr:phosphatidate cytidylyltransferase [Gleimia europaea]